jgi:hypothetical protein
MKKLSRYILIVIANIILPTFSFPSLAKDCPTIPETIKEVTVEDNAATLRTEPKKSSEKGLLIVKGDRLGVINHKPTQDSEGNDYCWYKVSPINDQDNREYWIAGVGLSEFTSFELDNNFLPSLRSNISKRDQGMQLIKKASNNENRNQTTIKDSPVLWQVWLTLIFASIGALSGLGSLVFIYISSIQQQRYLLRSRRLVTEKVDENNQQLRNHILHDLDSYYKRTKAKLNIISGQIIELKELNVIKLSEPESFLNLLSVNNDPSQNETIFYSENNDFTPIINHEINEIIDNFNCQNKDYFSFDYRFEPIGLTKLSIQSLVGEDIHRMIQLESFNNVNDTAKNIFLHIMLDGDNWLIPNINSPYIRQIINQLGEYPEIFIIHHVSDNLKLVRPAKLKNIGFDLWEIAEPGIFTKQDIIPEINLQSFHNLPSQNITSSLAFSPETINPKEIELGILNYLRKNENASFIDLLSNLQCDKQLLRDRLLILQEEEFIKIVNKADENNTVYKML